MTQDPASSRAFVPFPDSPVANAASGPLSGLTFAVKDIFDVAGYPTGCGSPHMLAMSGIKTASAPVVDALLAAGAVFAGKTHTEELAFSMTGKNAHYGAPRNGAAPERIAGGSSSGSAAAVSNGLCDFALGTDTGGSVRAPASHCGLIGLRPTHDRVSLDGCMPLAPGFDTCGWFARDMNTFARVGEVLLGEDTATLADTPDAWLPRDALAGLPGHVATHFAATLDTLRPRFGVIESTDVMTPSTDALYWAFRYIQGFQAWQSHGAAIEKHDFQLGPGVRERFFWSKTVTSGQNGQSENIRAQFRTGLLKLLEGGRVILMPTMPNVAPLLSESDDALDDYRNQSIRMLCISGLSGCPQITVPLMQMDGVPLGFSIIGAPGSDKGLMELARKLMV
ncbi:MULTISPECIES: amidase [Burkholderiaceae]|uniref:amidase n=1 Tax=Burkholderiaceae TaxID=119060 RepID=UPI00076AFB77|nr:MULTISPECIES: amidase [Burkholderiaceae]AMH43471.1 amidase [Burkholderia sp. PAMC 26561]